MKKAILAIIVTVLPSIFTYLNMDEMTRHQLSNNLSRAIHRHFLKQKIIAVLILMVVLGLLGSFIHTKNQPVVLNLAQASEISTAIPSVSCNFSVLGFIGPFGEASPQMAASKARISNIIMIDYYQQNYIFVQRNCVRVYGIER